MNPSPVQSSARLASSALVTLGMAATVGTALAFEHLGGYIPCALCLMQRDPYYYGIPVGILAVLNAIFGGPAWVTRVLLVIVGILMLVGAGIGVYHAGAEWHFWKGRPPARRRRRAFPPMWATSWAISTANTAPPARKRRCACWGFPLPDGM